MCRTYAPPLLLMAPRIVVELSSTAAPAACDQPEDDDDDVTCLQLHSNLTLAGHFLLLFAALSVPLAVTVDVVSSVLYAEDESEYAESHETFSIHQQRNFLGSSQSDELTSSLLLLSDPSVVTVALVVAFT